MKTQLNGTFKFVIFLVTTILSLIIFYFGLSRFLTTNLKDTYNDYFEKVCTLKVERLKDKVNYVSKQHDKLLNKLSQTLDKLITLQAEVKSKIVVIELKLNQIDVRLKRIEGVNYENSNKNL